jgi:hypothetical protein
MSAHLRERWAKTASGLPDLPDKGMFTRGKDILDPRIFEGDRMKAMVRDAVLSTLAGFWNPRYPNWHQWANVYLAGSAASYWWDSDTDLDILIGIDIEGLRQDRPQNVGVSEADICAHLDHELKTELDPLTTSFLGQFIATFFVNPSSYDIREIQPYAAYDITSDSWAVHPPLLPPDWGPRYFPESWWHEVLDLSERIEDIMEMPEPERTQLGVALFDDLHTERNKAYSPLGRGWTDWGNFAWQALSQLHQLQRLYRLKHPELVTANLSFAREGMVRQGVRYDDLDEREQRLMRSFMVVEVGDTHRMVPTGRLDREHWLKTARSLAAKGLLKLDTNPSWGRSTGNVKWSASITPAGAKVVAEFYGIKRLPSRMVYE